MKAPFSSRRRRIMQGMAATGALALAPRRVVGQSGASLLVLPRHALVIGNSSYKDAPLRNPANDARALAEELKGMGFEVVVRLDAGREEMLKAIQAYGGRLAQRKAVGLFYFAGHGAQLAWRNYLIPVDAVIETLDDVRERAVELNTLLQGLTQAKNPMNVIILDACRDSPFGKRVPVEQKGLSQFDAPPGSLLAYATAPGNVASDGEGANGLFTENLLRELKVPEAKIEDVFKRVRLNVRRRSNGRQIPWESTSLEEDFYFRPPRQLTRLAEAEATQRFEEELAVWEKIKEASDPQPLEDYLRRYPSGRFSELAQLRLDRVLARQGEAKIEIAPSAGNPYTAGSARADTGFKVGDAYTYRASDLFTGIEQPAVTTTVTRITDTEVIFNNGVLITDLLGNVIRLPDGRRLSGNQFLPPEYSLGKKWTTRFVVTGKDGGRGESEFDFKVVAREKLTVPAGTFDCFRVEGHGWGTGLKPGVRVQFRQTYWIAPDRVRRNLKSETLREAAVGGRKNVIESTRMELTAYRQS